MSFHCLVLHSSEIECCHFFSHRQAPFKFILLVVFISIGLETPRFFQFRVVHINNETIDFWTTDMMEDPLYIQFSSYWDEVRKHKLSEKITKLPFDL